MSVGWVLWARTSYQDPGFAVFNVLQFLDVLASDPSNKMTVVQMRSLWRTFSASYRVKVGRSLEMIKGGFAQVFYMATIAQVRLKSLSRGLT